MSCHLPCLTLVIFVSVPYRILDRKHKNNKMKYFQTTCLVLMLFSTSFAKHHKTTTRRAPTRQTTTEPPLPYQSYMPQAANIQPAYGIQPGYGHQPGYGQHQQPVVVHQVSQQQPNTGSSGLGAVGGLALGGLAGILK